MRFLFLQTNRMRVTMNTSHYLDGVTYNEMLDKLASVRPTLSQPCLRSAIIEILGEIGDIWPANICAGSENAS